MPDEAPDVSIVIVNFNGAAGLERCVASVLADPLPTREVFLVDNASTDGSLALARALAERHAGVHLVENASNLGYAAAVNGVLDACRGRHVAVLNMDLHAEPGWLGALTAHLDAHPQVGAVNPIVVLEDGETLNAAGQVIHVSGLGFNRDLGRPRASVATSPFPIAGLQGAAFVVRRELLAEMRGMDPLGFLYHEDVNLSWLLRLMGHELHCVPAAAVRHDYALSMNPEKLCLLERNRLALLCTHMRGATRLRLSPWLVATEFMLWGYALLRGPAYVAAKTRSYGWVLSMRASLRERRRFIETLRRVDDRTAMRPFAFRYVWSQFGALARERGTPRRQLARGAGD